ncbi:hypothetical protein A6R70_13200 [Agrobacterium rubi]|uniref:hypothetical protein n=1 Tax=Agrobacterium rubi TaxID=28099 RepID=UPI00201B7204|nr:hypothetical protein [Agrobacterium rubi]MCL6653245.1 hypothetical protein [Agrobacterium rubi]
MSSIALGGGEIFGDEAIGRAATQLGKKAATKLASRAALGLLGPLGAAIGVAMLAYDAYELYQMYNESHSETSDEDPGECTGDCAEAKKKREQEKIDEMDSDSTQKPGDKDFNKDRPGTFDDANKDFDDLVGGDSIDKGNGIRIGNLSDGRTVTVRPNSKSNGPTLDIIKPNGRPFRKYRYPGAPSS